MKSIQTRANVTLFFAEPGEIVPLAFKSLGRLKDLYNVRDYNSFARYLHCQYGTRNKLVNGVFEDIHNLESCYNYMTRRWNKVVVFRSQNNIKTFFPYDSLVTACQRAGCDPEQNPVVYVRAN